MNFSQMSPGFDSTPAGGAYPLENRRCRQLLTLVFLLLGLLASQIAGIGAEPRPGVLLDEFIFEDAPFAACHASTIEQTTSGELVAAWFGGSGEGKPDVEIFFTRQENLRWSSPVSVANGIQPDGSRLPCWNPVLFQPKQGPLLLFYKVGPSPATWWGMLRTSHDSGKTWSKAQRLPNGILGPIKNKPVQISDGSILCPTSSESTSRPSEWRVHFERTADLGATWERIVPEAPRQNPLDAIQPSILFSTNLQLRALGRTRAGKIFQSQSADGGKTWGPLTLTDLPNPNSGTDALTLRDGKHLIVYNHTAKGRSPLNVATSTDGIHWHAALVLEDKPNREFSYPAVIQSSDGLVQITYTHQRTRIKRVVVDPTTLQGIPIQNGEWPR